MSMKRPSLVAAMEALDTRTPRSADLAPALLPSQPARTSQSAQQPGRVGKKQVLGWFSAECKKQIKLIGVEQGRTEQDILAEALNDFFIKYGKPTLAL
jgi:hypothetical protein